MASYVPEVLNKKMILIRIITNELCAIIARIDVRTVIL